MGSEQLPFIPRRAFFITPKLKGRYRPLPAPGARGRHRTRTRIRHGRPGSGLSLVSAEPPGIPQGSPWDPPERREGSPPVRRLGGLDPPVRDQVRHGHPTIGRFIVKKAELDFRAASDGSGPVETAYGPSRRPANDTSIRPRRSPPKRPQADQPDLGIPGLWGTPSKSSAPSWRLAGVPK
jgi:hypothetical protein